MTQNNSTNQKNMNYKQYSQPQTPKSANAMAPPPPQTPATAASFLQRRTLFEGRVSGPMRFDEMVKAQQNYDRELELDSSDQGGGDQEILVMERNNLKLTFHSRSPQQNASTPTSASQNQHPQNSTSVIQRTNNALDLQQQQSADIVPTRYTYYGYGQRHPVVDVTTLADAVANVQSAISAQRRESPQQWTQQSNNNDNTCNNYKSTASNKWSSGGHHGQMVGQMEVTPRNNVHFSQNQQRIQQNHLDGMIQEAKKQQIYASSPDFIDQQLNNHLKSFKYIKPAIPPQQQQSKAQYQVGNSMSMSSMSMPSVAPAAAAATATVYHNPSMYGSGSSSTNTSATITKIPHVQTSPAVDRFFERGSPNNPAKSSPISALNTKSKANFKQKLQTTMTSPREALEHYEKLRKYWDYQHHLLSEDHGYKNYCSTNYNEYNNATPPPHPNPHQYGSKAQFSPGVSPGFGLSSPLSSSSSAYPELGMKMNAANSWNRNAYHQISPQQHNHTHAYHHHPYANTSNNSTNNHAQQQQQIRMQTDHTASNHHHLNFGTGQTARNAGFAAELEKLHQYPYVQQQQQSHPQSRLGREGSWPYSYPVKGTPPTPAQKKTYPNSNAYPDKGIPAHRQTNPSQAQAAYLQQFYRGAASAAAAQRKQQQISLATAEKADKVKDIHSPPPVPPSTPNNNHQELARMMMLMQQREASSPPPIRRQNSVIQNTEDHQKHRDVAEVEIVDCVEYSKPSHHHQYHHDAKDNNNDKAKGSEIVAKQEEMSPEDKDLAVESPTSTPTDLSLPRRRSDQDQRLLLLNRRFAHQRPPSPPQRSKSVGGVTDASGYDHIVLLDKRVMTYMCKRCLETLKSDQEIRNHLFCKMLQDSIQCHVCRNLYPTESYAEHLKGHGVRAFSN